MIHVVTNTVNVKTELVFVLLDGMEDIVRWKVVRMDVLLMDSVVLIRTELGNVDAIMDGMEKIVAFYWNKVVAMEEIMIKVRPVFLPVYTVIIIINSFFIDGLVDCEDPECCSNHLCRSSQLCVAAPKPIDILLRKQPPAITASFFERMKFLIDEGSLQNYARQETFNER